MGKSDEEDKIEKIIRKLLKLPENRRCINCNSLGPQYVCTSFWTFVCTNCSGVHREFTHRVKSVSMAKFFMEEIISLQAGGNEKARQVYFKTWDPLRNFFPHNSNVRQLREFIKLVYVDRHFTGEANQALVSRSRNSDMYDAYERRRSSFSGSYSFHERNNDSYSRPSFDELRSSLYNSRENSGYDVLRANSTRSEGTGVGYYQVDDPRHDPKYSTLRTKSSHFDSRGGRYQVDDRRESSNYGGSRSTSARFEGKLGGYQVDDTTLVGHGATHMFTTEDTKTGRRSPNREQRKDVHKNASVEHVKDILRENFLALRAANQPNFADRRSVRSIGCNQGSNYHREGLKGEDSGSASYQRGHRRTVSAYVRSISESDPQKSINNTAEMKRRSASVRSLDECKDFPSPDKTVQKASPQIHVAPKPPFKENASNAPAKNTLEYLLFELSTPEGKPPNYHSGIPCHDISMRQHGPETSTSEPQTLEPVPVASSDSKDTSRDIARTTGGDKFTVATPQMIPDLLGDDDMPPTNKAGQQQISSDPQYHEHSASLVPYSNAPPPQASHFNEGTNYEPTTLSSAPRAPAVNENFMSQTSQPSATEIQPSPEETKTGGRNELPAELFVSPNQLSSMPLPTSGWQTGPNYGMGFMHYYPPHMPMEPFPSVQAKSTNPFDTNDTYAQPQSNMAQFSSNGFWQGGLTNGFNPSSMPHNSSYGSHLPVGALHYPSSTPQQLSYASHGAYNMSHYPFHNMAPNSMQGAGGYGGEAGLNSNSNSNSNQSNPYIYQPPTGPNSFPKGGGNPFG